MSSLRNPTVPFNVPIPGGMTSGKTVVIQGKIPSMSHGFAINFITSSGDVALHISPNFKEKVIIRNNILNKNWGPEESHGSMPLRTNQLFEILIVCESYSFKISINEEHFCEFSHRLPFNTITNLAVDGDVLVHHVNFKGPNLNGNNNNNNNNIGNSDGYGFSTGPSSKHYNPSALYPTIDSLPDPSSLNSRRSQSPSAPHFPSSGGPLYPSPNAPQYPTGGSAFPGSGGPQYSPGGFTYPSSGGNQYPSGGNPYPTPNRSQYPNGGNTYPTPSGPQYSSGGNTYPAPSGPQYSSGGNTYPAPSGPQYSSGGNVFPGSGGHFPSSGDAGLYPGSGGSSYPQKPALYPTQPGQPHYPQLPNSHSGGVSPTPHSRPGFLDQAGAALAGVLGPTLLSGGMNRGSAAHGKPNLLDEAGRALAGVIGGAGLAGAGSSLKGTQPRSPTHQSGFLDQAGTALAGILGGAGLMGAAGRHHGGTTPLSPTRPTQPGTILDQAGSALAGILGGGLAGAGHHKHNKLGVLGGALGTAVAGAALTGHLNPIKATKKKLKAQKKALKYGLPLAGAGLGAYVLHKGLKKGFRRSSSSSSCSSSD